MKTILNQLKNGLLYQNPTLVLLLGMCPTLAVSTSVKNGLGMGVATALTLICSNTLISLLRKVIPQQIRIACYVVIISGFVTIIDLLLQAYLPDLSHSLGMFIPLIVVNCIVFARAEAFAAKNQVFRSAVDGLAMGLGFTASLVIVSSMREILSAGTWFGLRIVSEGWKPVAIMGLPPGGFLTLGCVIAAVQFFLRKKKRAATPQEGGAPQ